MRKVFAIIIVACLVAGIALVGCGPKKAETSQEAIKNAEALKTAPQKEKYLMQQAELFLKQKNFQEAINLSQYVLWNVDANSEAAKTMLRKAQDAMAVEIQLQKTAAVKK